MKKLIVFYDNWCPNCSRFINIARKLDFFNLIDRKRLRIDADINLFADINLKLAKQQMASFNGKWHYGFCSIYLIILRLPLLWFLIPITFLLKITNLGQFLYKEIALKRKIIPLDCNDKTCIKPIDKQH